MAEFAVTPEELRSVGRRVVEVADEAHRNCEQLSGAQDALGAVSGRLQLMAAAHDCEQSWQRAIEWLSARMAVAADKLDVNAANYTATEGDNVARFPAQGEPR